MFKPRLTIPESGNKYYNTTAAGGYAVGTVTGNPLCSGLNVLANCVGYAAARYNEIIGQKKWLYFLYPPDAENFVDVAKKSGLLVGTEPKLGALICWAKGQTWNPKDGAGHVAVVEKINADGSIITSESGYGCANPFWTSAREKGNGNWGAGTDYRFVGFIYQPNDSSDTLIKKGDRGNDVRWMQEKLAEKGYLRKNEIDGIFGTITLGALLAFQFEHSLDVDGICGEKTKAALNA